MNLDAPIMTRREALEKANVYITAVIAYCLNEGLELDDVDKEYIRNAHEMVKLALRDDAAPEPRTMNPIEE